MSLSLKKLLPHRGKMKLLDSVIDVNNTSATCQVTINKESLFFNHDINGIYSWVGIEFMAQTTAVFASFQHRAEKAKIGFLISVRKFSAERPSFELGETLTIVANNEYLENNLGVFQCEIFSHDKLVASARLSAFQPSDQQAKEILNGE